MCFERGGWQEDSNAFREFCQDIFDTDKVEEAFVLRYEIKENRTPNEFFADAQVFLKLAGVALAKQKKKYGEDNWDLFMEQVKAMKARERRRKENGHDLVEDTEDMLAQIRNGDSGIKQTVVAAAKWAWERYYAATPTAADAEEDSDGSLEEIDMDPDWEVFTEHG